MQRRTLGRRLAFLVAQWLIWFFLAMAAVTALASHQLRRSTAEDRLLLARSVARHVDSSLEAAFSGLRRLGGELPDANGEASGRLRAFRLHSPFRHAVALVGDDGEVLAADPSGALPTLTDWLRNAEAVTPLLPAGGSASLVAIVQPVSRQGRRLHLVGLMEPRSSGVGAILEGLETGPGIHVAVVDAAGAVLAGRGAPPGPLRLVGLEELPRAIAEHRPLVAQLPECPLCQPPGTAGGYLTVVVPLRFAPWAVVVQQPRRQAAAPLRTFQAGQLAAAAVLVLLGALAFRGISRSVVGPLESLSRQALRLREGDLSTPIDIAGDHEVEVLGAALDEARRQLGAMVGELEGVNENLEGLVAERTLALQAEHASRRGLVRRLLTATEEERRRLARELHDEIAQLLTVVQLALARGVAAEGVERARELLTRTQQEVHRIIHDLRPSLLDDLGLAAAVRWYADNHLAKAGIAVRVEVEEPGELPPEVEISTFRIYQEIVTNVLRHSGAEDVGIELFRDGDRLVLQVEDDGVGFDPAEKVAGVGLVGMRERAALVEGTLRVESEPGMGTLIRLEIPLAAPAAGRGAP
jgi:signal transduction histidine kinase